MTDDKYEVRSCVPEAAIQVCTTKDPHLTLKITLSSLAMRDEQSATEEGIDSSSIPLPPPPSTHLHLCLLLRQDASPVFIWPFYDYRRLKGKEEGKGCEGKPELKLKDSLGKTGG